MLCLEHVAIRFVDYFGRRRCAVLGICFNLLVAAREYETRDQEHARAGYNGILFLHGITS